MEDWTYAPPDGPPPVLYEDRDLVVVDKPSGLLSVPGRTHHDSAQSRVSDTRGTVYPVHRLDLDTSGALAFATRRKAERSLMLQFRARTVRKTYLAWVAGRPPDEFVVNAPLERLSGVPMSRICPSGKPAQTRGRCLNSAGDHTLVELFPETGRSHQLRLHMLHLGHPILGDRFYAPPAVRAAAPRLMLHAWRLTFAQPHHGTPVRVEAPPPFSLTGANGSGAPPPLA
jgi:tRNA pseudouridine32 synthase/23S rRNA pseudouridine746 synthase